MSIVFFEAHVVLYFVYAYTVEPPNKGNIGAWTIVHYSEVVLYVVFLSKRLLILYCRKTVETERTVERNGTERFTPFLGKRCRSATQMVEHFLDAYI